MQSLYDIARIRNQGARKANVKHGKGSGFTEPGSLPDLTAKRVPFNLKRNGTPSATLFGRWEVCPTGLVFCVYSYGEHFPVAVYSELSLNWYVTTSGRSVTTTMHTGRVRVGLRNVKTVPLDCDGLRHILKYGENAEVEAQHA